MAALVDDQADEAHWMRASLDLCGGSFVGGLSEISDELSEAKTWREAHGVLQRLRTEFIETCARKAGFGAEYGADARWAPPETLPWGNEVWTRREHPAALRIAFERCCFLFPKLLDGADDPQCDHFPVAVALYSRNAAAPADGGALGAPHLGTAALPGRLGASLRALADSMGSHALGKDSSFDPSCEDHVRNLVGEPCTVQALLEVGPSPFFADMILKNLDVVKGRCLEIAVSRAIASCAPFVELCTTRGVLTPAEALGVVRKTVRTCGWDGCSLPGAVGDFGGDVVLGATAPDDDSGPFVVAADAVSSLLEASVKAARSKRQRLAEGSELHLPLEFAADTSEFLEALIKREDAALRTAICAEIKAANAGAPLSDVVVPLGLSQSDMMSRFPGSGLRDGSNDHEGQMSCAYVAPTWALVLCYKVSSC